MVKMWAEQENKNIRNTTRVFEVLPGNICILYFPQNSGPDNILKGNDHRLIKSSQTCFCCSPYPSPHLTSLVFTFFWINFSRQILGDLIEGNPMPEQALPNLRVLCMQEEKGCCQGVQLHWGLGQGLLTGEGNSAVTHFPCHQGS